MVSPIPVSVGGFTWTAGLVALLNLLVGGLLVAIVKTRPALKKIANEREANLLAERAEEMEVMRRQIATLQAEQRVDRHEIGNLDQCLDALLMMIELDPAKAPEAAAKIKEMRAKQKLAVAAEKASIHAENIAGRVG